MTMHLDIKAFNFKFHQLSIPGSLWQTNVWFILVLDLHALATVSKANWESNADPGTISSVEIIFPLADTKVSLNVVVVTPVQKSPMLSKTPVSLINWSTNALRDGLLGSIRYAFSKEQFARACLSKLSTW